jgi:hypothetical protein
MIWRRKQSAANQSPWSNSLLTGKNTGNFTVFEAQELAHCQNMLVNWALLAEFPTNANRELWSDEQGIQKHNQGNVRERKSEKRGAPSGILKRVVTFARARLANLARFRRTCAA